MIRRIELTNFRRHADTVLEFTPDEQLVVISGHNGSGKSTLISEALMFAFFGESRHGRRRLDELVRRGAELEGVEVTVVFELANNVWEVTRRRVEGTGTALLRVDGLDIADGTTAVDAEITKLLGMDAAGFRLAVLARQKELDGLTSLDKATRRRVLGRLLRIDAVGRAAAKAADDYNRASDILAAIGSAPDPDALELELDLALAAMAAADTTVADARTAVERAEAVAADAATLDARAREAEARAAAADAARGAADAARGAAAQKYEAARAAADAAGTPAPPPRPSVEVASDRTRTATLLDGAEAAARAVRDREVLEADLATATAELAELNETAATLEGADTAVTEARERYTQLRAQTAGTRDALSAAEAAVAVAEENHRRAVDTALNFATVGSGICDRCGSTVDDDHIEAHKVELSEAVDVAADALAAALAARDTAASAQRAAEETLAAARTEGERLAERAAELTRVRERLAETTRRVAVLTQRAAAPAPVVPDTDKLTDTLVALDIEFEAAQRSEAAVSAAQRAAELAVSAEAALAEATDAATRAAAEATAAEVPAELADARARNEAATRDLVVARERFADARATHGTAAADAARLRERLADARSARESYERRELAARHAAHTKAVLRQCHEQLSAGLRPALEASASQLLSRLSEGRFPSVKVTGDYDIMVSDDGDYRMLSELSGGETDLVALAVRLALAQVVADRRGSDALGLLVLDEVFGSQDEQRRGAILGAMRELRSIYGQIFLISHVGGVEENADRVVELSLDEDRVATTSDV